MSAAAYLVKGTDPMLRARVVDELLAELLGDDDPTLALEEITIPGRAGGGSGGDDSSGGVAGGLAGAGAEAREAAVAMLLNAVGSPPFMTEHRIVVARDIGALAAGEIDGILRYLDDPLDTTILVLVGGGGTTPPALVKKLKAVKAVERAPESEATDKVLIAAAHEAGVLFAPDAATLISTHLGSDAGRVAALVDVLASAFPAGTSLQVDDVRPYLGDAGAVAPYLLTNAIEQGDPAEALEILHRLLTVSSPQQPKPMHPLQVMGLLANNYRRVMRLDDPSIRSRADAVEALGGKVKEYPAGKALDQSRALGAGGIRQAFDALFQADLDLKGARGIPEQAVMEVLVVRLARLAARTGGGRRRR